MAEGLPRITPVAGFEPGVTALKSSTLDHLAILPHILLLPYFISAEKLVVQTGLRLVVSRQQLAHCNYYSSSSLSKFVS